MSKKTISDEERREVAQKLRTLADGGSPMTECSVDALYTALGLPCSGTGLECAVIGYLADLTDRPTCRNVSGHQDVFECSECRCRVELITEACNEYGETFNVPLMPSWCPNCGESVVG